MIHGLAFKRKGTFTRFLYSHVDVGGKVAMTFVSLKVSFSYALIYFSFMSGSWTEW